MSYERVFMEIELAKISANIKAIREHVNEKAKLMAVVKADGYGHGAVEISKTAILAGADQLGVAICDEGVMLREAGITCPILILGYNPVPKMLEALNFNLVQTIFSYKMAKELSEIAVSNKKTAQIHIKIDTGMNRIGFRIGGEAKDEIREISKLPNIEITGIYSHFAMSDSIDKQFAYEQYASFMGMVKVLNKEGVDTGIKHISNSGAILELSDFSCDMVRAGIITYGYAPSDNMEPSITLTPAMSLKTYVSHTKEICSGESVGYGRRFFAKRKMKVATIPVGYADGYSRSLSGKGRVLISGKYAQILGNICMDQFMVDISHIDDVKQDDEVVLIGTQGGNTITVQEIAAIGDTISYEIICCIGKRVPRVYK